MTMDEKIPPVIPYGRNEFINFIERLLVSICIILVACVLFERHGVGLRDIILGWVFLSLTWKGTVDDVLFKFFEETVKHIKAFEDKENADEN